ncbi:Hint domain-containing protein [Ancylobacter oerskovii]|uniref:Hint domain-containing protein n=1 Tax=Ancylobacter oerskovii TaxID=459519 RepID=A0ABW4Z341_9HYPH|nr:Hint domain-containing protein [Ancylobacter oerskovii]MBS7546174.1 Hint domain-containing protein [Ancylobacter oerskovii]
MALLDANLFDSSVTYDSTNLPPGETNVVTITALGSNTLTLDGVDTTVDYGLVGAQAVSNVTIAAIGGSNVVVNNPDVAVAVGTNFIYSVGGTSSMEVNGSNVLNLPVGVTQSVAFDNSGAGTFIYDSGTLLGLSPTSTTISVTGFATGDTLGYQNATFNAFSYNAGTSVGTITFNEPGLLGSTVTQTFNLQGLSASDAAAIQAAITAGTFVDADGNVVMPVCFVRGTLIETPEGPVAIETLKIGDKVIGRSGVREVKWIGWRDYGRAYLRTNEQKRAVAPVRVRAGAFADNVPSRDLLVSPWHHLFVSGKLVRANDLVNGMTIVQELNTPTVSYWHIELDQFDVVRAHGMFSEAWADGGNRDFFQNVDVTALRPEDRKRRKADRPGFEALRDEKRISVIREKVAARARKLAATEATVESTTVAA